MPLALLDFDAGTRAELLHFLTAELAPSGEGRRVEIDALVLRDVGVSLLDESLNLLHDLVHIVRCEGVQVDGRAVQPLHHVPEFREILRDDLVPRPPGRLHLRDDAVLDVRHVLQIEDVEALGAEVPGDDVERRRRGGDVGLCVPHVGLVLRRESADEKGDALAMEGDERLLLPREGVVHSKRHSLSG